MVTYIGKLLGTESGSGEASKIASICSASVEIKDKVRMAEP